MSAKCPSFIAPAMDFDMYAHPFHQRKFRKTERFGHHIILLNLGNWVSGLEGQGRLAENRNYFTKLEFFCSKII